MEFSIFTFPFQQIGWGLRQLSLSGVLGNVTATIIYLVIGLIPCGIHLGLRKNGKLLKMDGMLFVLSAALFVLLYYMINPGLFQTALGGSGTFLLAGTFYSIFVGYLVLRILKRSENVDMKALQKGLRFLLHMVMILFVAVILMECFVALPTEIDSVREGNSAAVGGMMFDAADLTMTNVFLILQCVVSMLPYGLNTVIVYFCIKALDELLVDSCSDKAVAAVKKIVGYCRNFLTVIVISVMVLNIAQILFRNQIYQVNITVNIPVFSLLFIVAVYVMARYIEENQKLKRDNSLFI